MNKPKLSVFFSLFAMIISMSSFAQTAKQQSLSIGLSYVWHGSGDMHGGGVDFGHEFDLNRRFSVYNNLAFTYNGTEDPAYSFIAQPTNPMLQTSALYFLKAGIQTNPTLLWKLINKDGNEIKFGAGPLLRYQLSAYPGAYGYSSGSGNNPQPYYTILQSDSKPRTLAAGYRFGAEYQWTRFPKINLGFKAYYQGDTEGDRIMIVGIQLAKKLIKCEEKAEKR